LPPTPQVDPNGDGITKSAIPTFAPNVAASLEQAIPPEPPPEKLNNIANLLYLSRTYHSHICTQ